MDDGRGSPCGRGFGAARTGAHLFMHILAPFGAPMPSYPQGNFREFPAGPSAEASGRDTSRDNA